jgi:aldehyde:ferredoxin oxidoreductase
MACLEAEYAYNGKQRFEEEEIRDFINSHATTSVKDLHDYWAQFVGEWLASRHDMPPANSDFDDDTFESWLHSQWNALVNDNVRDYGYVLSVIVTARDVSKRTA